MSHVLELTQLFNFNIHLAVTLESPVRLPTVTFDPRVKRCHGKPYGFEEAVVSLRSCLDLRFT